MANMNFEKMAQAQQILNSKDPNAILKQMNNNNKQ